MNNQENNIVGDFYNYGGFYVTSDVETSGLSAYIKGTNIINSATLYLSSIESSLKPTYVLSSTSFLNTGVIYFAESGDTAGTYSHSMNITAPEWDNQGAIFYEKKTRTSSYAMIGTKDTLGTPDFVPPTANNDGQICLTNQIFEQTTNLTGSGCIYIGTNSVFYANFKADDQSIYFSSTGGRM